VYDCILALDNDRFTKKILKYQISCKSVQWGPSCFVQTDRHTDGQTCEANSCSFANAPKNKVNNIFFSSKLYLLAQIFTRISEDVSFLNDTSQNYTL